MKRSLRRELERRGATGDEIDAATRDGTLTLLAFDKILMPGARRYTIREVAERAGADLETAHRLWRAVGFPDVPPDAREFTDADVAALRRVARRIRVDAPWAFPTERAIQQSRVVSAALARVADVEAAGAAEGVRGVRELGLTDEEIAEGVLREFHFEEIASLIDYAHRLQLRAAVLRRLARPTATDTLTLAVGFIDLVGYTALVEELDDDALAALVEHFAAVAFDTVAAGGARVVKTIGDAVMFVADDPATAARVALRLARAPRDDPLLPEARIGVACGPVVARAGDYYGAVVNLASRLTEGARPGTVLVSAEVHDALAADPSFAFVDLGLRKLRDIGRVPVFVLRSAGAESQAAPAGS